MEVEGVQALKVSQGITVLRGICNNRLKFDIEYSRKRGTTDNTYLIKVRLQLGVDRLDWENAGRMHIDTTQAYWVSHTEITPFFHQHQMWEISGRQAVSALCMALHTRRRCMQQGTHCAMCL